MPSCAVKNCKNRSSQKSFKQEVLEEKVKISFHRFPKRDDKRNLWMRQLGLKQSDLHNDTVVCSIHFKAEDFDKSSMSRIRLHPNAVPSVQVSEERRKIQSMELFNDHSYSRLHPERELNDNADARRLEQNLEDNPDSDAERSEQNLRDNPDAESSEQNLRVNLGAERSEQDLKADSDAEHLQKIPKYECSLDTVRVLQKQGIKNDPDAKHLLVLAKVESPTSARVLEKQNIKNNLDTKHLLVLAKVESPTSARVLQKQDIKKDPDAKHLLVLTKVESPTRARIFCDNDKGVQVNVAREDKATCISPERLFHTPEKDQLREHLARVKKDYQNQLRVLRQKCKRANRRIEDLKAIVRFNKEQFIRSRTNPRQDFAE